VVRDEIVKGFEVSKGNFVLLDEDEIEAAKIESKRTLELVQFVDANEIDIFYFEKPYYVVPQDDLAEEAYIVLRDALKAKKKVALGQLSVRGREQLVSLKPCGRGIVMETLRYEDEVRRAQTYFKDIPSSKPAKPMLDLAGSLIDQKSGPFDASEFHDRYVEALKRLIEKKSKSKGKKVLEDVEEPAARGSNVIDLMAALKQSVGGKTAANDGEAKKPGAKKAPAKKAPASKAAPAAKARKRA
jgi:DNA end-binding protein Ku